MARFAYPAGNLIFAIVMSGDRVVIVTGGTRGVGRAVVTLFARKGWRVFFSARHAEAVQALQMQLRDEGRIVEGYACDLTRKSDIEKWVRWLQEKTDRIDVLVNNAGTFIPGKIQTEDDATFEHLMALNAGAPYYLTKRLLPMMTARKSGLIVNISSTAGLQPYPNGASYCISKYALTGFSKVLREELKPTGVRVSTLYPGPVYTDSWEGTPYEPHRFILPDTLARIIHHLTELPADAVVEDLVVRPQAGDFSESEMNS